MKHLVGHDQNDAQEFFHAFLDCLATHAITYEKTSKEMRQTSFQSQIKRSSSVDINHIKNDDAGEIALVSTSFIPSMLLCKMSLSPAYNLCFCLYHCF